MTQRKGVFFFVYIIYFWPRQVLVAAHGLFVAVRRLLSSCSMRALLPRSMWDPSYPIRDRTHVPCIGRQILNHWATGEVPRKGFKLGLSAKEDFHVGEIGKKRSPKGGDMGHTPVGHVQ